MNKYFFIVDDDEDDRFLFREALREVAPEIGCREANNGRIAIERLSAENDRLPTVIFLDINMPVMNGWECMERLKADKHLARVPVIIYSTSSMSHDIQRGLSMGAMFFCIKLDDYEKLKTLLELIAANYDKDIEKALKSSPVARNCHFRIATHGPASR